MDTTHSSHAQALPRYVERVYDTSNLPTDRDAILALLARIEAEVADIDMQMTARKGDTSSWWVRASYALRARQRVKVALEKRLNRIDATLALALAEREKALGKRAAQERQATMQREAAAAKADRIAAANCAERAQFRLLKAWLKTAHPSVWAEAIAFLSAQAGE